MTGKGIERDFADSPPLAAGLDPDSLTERKAHQHLLSSLIIEVEFNFKNYNPWGKWPVSILQESLL